MTVCERTERFERVLGERRGLAPEGRLDATPLTARAIFEFERLYDAALAGGYERALSELGTDQARINAAPLLATLDSALTHTLTRELLGAHEGGVGQFLSITGLATLSFTEHEPSEGLTAQVGIAIREARAAGVADPREHLTASFGALLVAGAGEDAHAQAEVLFDALDVPAGKRAALSADDWRDVLCATWDDREDVAATEPERRWLRNTMRASLLEMLSARRTGRDSDLSGRYERRYSPIPSY